MVLKVCMFSEYPIVVFSLALMYVTKQTELNSGVWKNNQKDPDIQAHFRPAGFRHTMCC